MTTERSVHTDACGYSRWYDQSARWQPNLPEGGELHPLSQLVREIIVEMYCDCGVPSVQRGRAGAPAPTR